MSSILILGASYGSLFATKLLLAGHSVQLVALPRVAVSCSTSRNSESARSISGIRSTGG